MDRLRSALYTLKRVTQRHPLLYRWIYAIATFNWDYQRQRSSRHRYPSHFGGLWTDRTDFDRLLARRLRRGEIDQAEMELCTNWRRDGFLVLRRLIDDARIDRLNADLKAQVESGSSDLLVASAKYDNPRPLRPGLITASGSCRILDSYFHLDSARDILFDKQVQRILTVLFGKQPRLTQSLNFVYGSEQSVHQDTGYVITNSPYKMAGVWIALEDVRPGSGELLYYPGSHRRKDFLFSGHFKHFDGERDGDAQQSEWLQWIHDENTRQGSDLTSFRARKGDVMIWHADLAHGGAKQDSPGLTRRSLVGHYCPRGVRPLYHYYKPAHRKWLRDGFNVFSSAYYKPQGAVERKHARRSTAFTSVVQ